MEPMLSWLTVGLLLALVAIATILMVGTAARFRCRVPGCDHVDHCRDDMAAHYRTSHVDAMAPGCGWKQAA